MGSVLQQIDAPRDLRKLDIDQLKSLAAELRGEMIKTVSATGGHLASSLGAIELTIAIHYVFNTPDDKVVWDVGHQTYAHKLLTGRRRRFSTLRQLGGLSGFPNKDESSEYDIFTCGHSSVSISTALGLVVSRDIRGTSEKVVAVVGDASLAGGVSFEALNHTGHTKKNLIVILNDNERSISQSVGALSKYLNRIITNPAYNRIRLDVEKLVKRIPRFGFRAYRAARKLEEGLKNLLTPGMIFEEMGFRYFGPIDGHNIGQLVWTLNNIKALNEPIFLHVITKKGKGYRCAEEDPTTFHGTGPFDENTGIKRGGSDSGTFTESFGKEVCELAGKDKRIVAITAAMIDGTGLVAFANAHPDRFFDVGIAEEHAVSFSAGLARSGLRPIVAIYSTFLQRGYDQIIHDVCLQNLPVVLCLDRAGLVGEDGPTHHGSYDIAYLRHIPNLTVMAPATPLELAEMLRFATKLKGPVAIRYPKGGVKDPAISRKPIEAGKSEIIKEGSDIAIIAVGNMVEMAVDVASELARSNIDAVVVNARFIKPLDEGMITDMCTRVKRLVTIEDGCLEGGFGSAILEFIESSHIKGVQIRRFGLPDRFIEHGKKRELFAKYNLTPQAICAVIKGEVMS